MRQPHNQIRLGGDQETLSPSAGRFCGLCRFRRPANRHPEKKSAQNQSGPQSRKDTFVKGNQALDGLAFCWPPVKGRQIPQRKIGRGVTMAQNLRRISESHRTWGAEGGTGKKSTFRKTQRRLSVGGKKNWLNEAQANVRQPLPHYTKEKGAREQTMENRDEMGEGSKTVGIR